MVRILPPCRRLCAAIAGLAILAVPLSTRAADPYDVYALLPLTGFGAFYGTPQQQTLHAVEGVVNKTGGIGGRPLHFVIQDDQSNPQIDVQLASQIIAKGVPAILGPTMTAQCNAVTPLVKNGPVTFCFTPGVHPEPGSYVFASGGSTEDLMAVAMRYFNDRGLKRIATITSTDASGQDGDRMIDATAGDFKTLTLVDREHFNPTDVTVAAQIAHMKGSNPQAVIVWTTGTPFGTILRGLHDADLEIPVLTTNGNLTYGQMKQYADFLPRDLVFPSAPFLTPEQVPDRATKDALRLLYTQLAAVGAKPDQGNDNCWDPAMLLVSALKKFGPEATAAQVHDYVVNLKGWSGINGVYDFPDNPQRGLDKNQVVMVRWDQPRGTWVALSKLGGAPLGGR